MGFNYGIEKKKFNEEWKKLQKEYEEAGMSEKSIQEIYEFDLNVFRKNRTEINHIISRDRHVQSKDRCDFCNHRYGYDYIIRSKGAGQKQMREASEQ